MPRRPRVLTRRTAVAVAVGGALVLAGCDLDDLTGARGPLGTGDATGSDPDGVLVDDVLVDLEARLAVIVDARARFPRLRVPLHPLQQMYEAHRAVLSPEPSGSPAASSSSPSAPPATPAPADPVRLARLVREAGSAHQEALLSAAVASRSGAMARLFASMSASVAQHLTVLPTDLGRAGGAS